MIVSTFSVSDKDDRERFFEENFLLTDVNLDVELGMPFLTMSNIGVIFNLGTYNEGLTLLETYF